MDIDLLWAIGGWFLFFDCMAASSSSSTSSSLSEGHTKLNHLFITFFLFLSLLSFVFLVSTIHPMDGAEKPSLVRSSSSLIIARRLLLSSSDHSMESSSSSSSTVSFHPKKASNRKASSRQFEAGAHEVPSGPNPISNR
ncbi:CLAVATA3/ESR (CLE)-related protein TDIF [Rhodamnia argentea]|uniref:CLAVATA3/ESR (CLE)-related protein TDIF n=1 Tax=Rhodamnia argentea TaxID=178133 RepID=A0ABM3HQM4_9MYRT|nr:CLAVATA3/ESR (CLE)-related protein TDIF [Rhodamnia argentea]XP_048138898.1 CLAVATA3/ESR (CLE)-related protein TDIF [Rhodamnia argentea]